MGSGLDNADIGAQCGARVRLSQFFCFAGHVQTIPAPSPYVTDLLQIFVNMAKHVNNVKMSGYVWSQWLMPKDATF
jgi:hypothetical protein